MFLIFQMDSRSQRLLCERFRLFNLPSVYRFYIRVILLFQRFRTYSWVNQLRPYIFPMLLLFRYRQTKFFRFYRFYIFVILLPFSHRESKFVQFYNDWIFLNPFSYKYNLSLSSGFSGKQSLLQQNLIIEAVINGSPYESL